MNRQKGDGLRKPVTRERPMGFETDDLTIPGYERTFGEDHRRLSADDQSHRMRRYAYPYERSEDV